jgi:hypothetical protein
MLDSDRVLWQLQSTIGNHSIPDFQYVELLTGIAITPKYRDGSMAIVIFDRCRGNNTVDS